MYIISEQDVHSIDQQELARIAIDEEAYNDQQELLEQEHQADEYQHDAIADALF